MMMLEHGVARLVVVSQGRITGIVSRHDALASLLRADDALAAAISRLLRHLDEGDVVATVVDGHVTLDGTVAARSRAATLPAQVHALDGVMSVKTSIRWSKDDLAAAPTR